MSDADFQDFETTSQSLKTSEASKIAVSTMRINRSAVYHETKPTLQHYTVSTTAIERNHQKHKSDDEKICMRKTSTEQILCLSSTCKKQKLYISTFIV